MGNEFVSYLNSMNNANANNKNALAESQVTNEYYHKIKVARGIGKEIYKELFDGSPKSIILTGHAGDGKTGLLSQILDEIGYFNDKNKSLKQVEKFSGNKEIFYVKDMSELDEKEQEKNLIKFLEAPLNGISAILIGNTGPLLNTFKRLIKKEDIEAFENDFLDGLDLDYKKDENVCINNSKYKFDLVNIARVDNTYFSSRIIENIIKKELWCNCETCGKANICPIYSNYSMISEQEENIKRILEKIYFWLSETGSRLTIRQILSHISYSITGNLDCEKISKLTIANKEWLFNYAFPNLFFGYNGIKKDNNSFNIKAIRELDKLSLDKKSFFKLDNIMFVKEDFTIFTEQIEVILENKLENNLLDLGLDSDDNRMLRRSFRRFAILANNNNELNKEIINTIFSPIYNRYFDIVTTGNIQRGTRREFENIIFTGLYKAFTGVYPEGGAEIINITLKRNLDDHQNVQLVLGEFRKRDLNLGLELINNLKEKESFKKANLILNISDIKYEVTHEMLDYLRAIAEGSIFTSYNPNFTFGMSKLKSKLINRFRYKESDDTIFLIIKKSGIEKVNIYIEDNKLNAEVSGGSI